MILVIGASGAIGSRVLVHLNELGTSATGTYCTRPADGLIHFDYAASAPTEILERIDADYAVVSAAAFATIDGTRAHWDEAYQTNVVRARAFIDACFSMDVTPIYISTDNVFDGVNGWYTEECERNPINRYGEIRFLVENHLLSAGKPFVILRMGKVFGLTRGDGTLITELLERLESGREFYCATDQTITPLWIDDLAPFINRIREKKLTGVYHVGSTKPTTIYELCARLADFFGLAKTFMKPCRINELDLLEERPVNLQLDLKKFKRESGFTERKVEFYFSRLEPSLNG